MLSTPVTIVINSFLNEKATIHVTTAAINEWLDRDIFKLPSCIKMLGSKSAPKIATGMYWRTFKKKSGRLTFDSMVNGNARGR